MPSAAWVSCFAPALMWLAGCGEGHAPDSALADFGAEVVARAVVEAQQKCNAAGMPDLYECVEAPRSASGERMAARKALDVYRTFQWGCDDTAGADRCEALAQPAYRKAGGANAP